MDKISKLAYEIYCLQSWHKYTGDLELSDLDAFELWNTLPVQARLMIVADAASMGLVGLA